MIPPGFEEEPAPPAPPPSAPTDPWMGLLHDGAMPPGEPDAAPSGYMVQAAWRTLLEDAVQAGKGAHWLAWLHAGLLAKEPSYFIFGLLYALPTLLLWVRNLTHRLSTDSRSYR